MANLGIDRAFWKERRVFLTGHTGFKGSWLSLWLADMGASVHGFALPPAIGPGLFELAHVRNDIEHVIGDLRSADDVLKAMHAAEPEVVFHLGAQSLVRASYEDPIATYATNVMGTAHVLKSALELNSSAARENRNPVRAVIVVTSDKCYLNKETPDRYNEEDPLGGYDPYSSSKAAAEIVTAAFRSSYGALPYCPAIATARAGNVIGGGDWAPDRLVPDAVRASAHGQTLLIRNPNAIRPWQHVIEPLAGYLKLAQELASNGDAFAEAWNFGPDERSERPVREVVEALAKALNLSWTSDQGDHPHEAQLLKLDSAKAHGRLGWQPRLSLEAALALTCEWYALQKQGEQNMRTVTFAQIGQYSNG